MYHKTSIVKLDVKYLFSARSSLAKGLILILVIIAGFFALYFLEENFLGFICALL